ncbi:hypothetical protein ACFFS2_29535 [Streptomyces aurantiacus]|uniref:Uncharacterized protein n=1 Tax=Streptomyces aurantiacus TaxID=47760 RepID=A0A7G1PFQ5_9ACTN|nr:hypothetical protein [Streptomyces aurantiacus]BCL33381.1 hypothetical protein GCM10017557_82400 [Streptomyces aurantiacus]
MGKFFDNLKNALRDQAVGSMKYGASTSYRHNRAAILAAKAEREERERRQGQHAGGMEESEHGFIDGHPVTFALGWGDKAGHTYLADGHITHEQFRDSKNHDHYGPGSGPRNNGTLSMGDSTNAAFNIGSDLQRCGRRTGFSNYWALPRIDARVPRCTHDWDRLAWR